MIASAGAPPGCLIEHPKSTNWMELWGQGTQSENPQLHPEAKPLIGLCYFDTFQTCNILIFTTIAAFFIVFCRQHYADILEWRICLARNSTNLQKIFIADFYNVSFAASGSLCAMFKMWSVHIFFLIFITYLFPLVEIDKQDWQSASDDVLTYKLNLAMIPHIYHQCKVRFTDLE